MQFDIASLAQHQNIPVKAAIIGANSAGNILAQPMRLVSLLPLTSAHHTPLPMIVVQAQADFLKQVHQEELESIRVLQFGAGGKLLPVFVFVFGRMLSCRAACSWW